MTVKTLEEEIEIIKSALDAFPKYKNVYANEKMLLEACQGKPANASTVRATLANIKHKLAVNGDYAMAYDQLWQRYPQFRTEANIHILDSIASVHKTVTFEILLKIIESPDVRKRLVLTPRAVQANADEAERLQLIEAILAGKKSYEWRGNVDGRLYSSTRAELEAETDLSRLREINEIVQFQRALYARDTKEVRAEQRATELRQAQIRAGMKAKPEFASIPDAYESPNRPGVKQNWSENLLRRLPNAEISRLFETYGEAQLNDVCRKSAAQQLL